MLPTKKTLFSFLISTLVAISTATVPCCDFFDPTCTSEWTSPAWQPSTLALPDTTGYPGFIPSHPDPYYEWLQDRSGALTSLSNYAITVQGAVISLDYYYYRQDPLAADDYFHVTFTSSSALTPNVLAIVTVPYDGWRHLEIICDASLDYCCGAYDAVPCIGTFEIIGSLNTVASNGLFGVDNFGECKYVPTTTPPYTLPPPVPAGCCTFEANVCGITASGWYWTANRPNPYPIPPYSGNYLWTDITSATAYSYEQFTIQYYTTFAVTYYIASSVGAIDVSFREESLSPRLVDTLSYTFGGWQHRTFSAYSLCAVTGFPCNGQFIFTARPGGNVVAIDDVDRDGQCHGALPCCYFDDPYFCDFINPGYLGNAWKWSGNSFPVNPPPNPGSGYIYFETVGYSGLEFSAPLYSNTIGVSSTTYFIGNFFSRTPFGPTGIEGLELTFTELTTGTVTYMDYVKETYGSWMEVTFYCRSAHGDCCQGLGPSCSGSLAFVAHVQDNGGSVLYGIDAISDGSCVPFPGLKMESGSGNSTVVRLHA